MPINKDEWESGRTSETTEAQILTFLKENRDQAFSIGDIYTALGYRINTKDPLFSLASVLVMMRINEALKTLAKEGRVKAKDVQRRIGKETYYMVS